MYIYIWTVDKKKKKEKLKFIYPFFALKENLTFKFSETLKTFIYICIYIHA